MGTEQAMIFVGHPVSDVALSPFHGRDLPVYVVRAQVTIDIVVSTVFPDVVFAITAVYKPSLPSMKCHSEVSLRDTDERTELAALAEASRQKAIKPADTSRMTSSASDQVG
jgi:hypothetical protein